MRKRKLLLLSHNKCNSDISITKTNKAIILLMPFGTGKQQMQSINNMELMCLLINIMRKEK